MKRNRKAKIIATLGPASSTKETIRKLFIAGADVFRLNFSHGSHEVHAQNVKYIREIEKEIGRPISILQDLQGPKIRIGELPKGGIELIQGEIVRLELGDKGDSTQNIPLPHAEIIDSLTPQDILLIDDGRLKLKITSCFNQALEAEVIYGGTLTSHKGLNLPGTLLDFSPLTAKDKADLEFGRSLGVDWVALSFVQRPSDVIEAQQLLDGSAGLIAKIEKPSALEQIERIVQLSDGIMVARGDLGVELPPEEVPGHQKELIRICRHAGKPVIVATQMLESMMSSPQPTRAEASDVATAIYDGADAVMLSGESAAGKYPIEAVDFMNRVIAKTEQHKDYRSLITALHPIVEHTIQHAVSAAANDVASAIQASAILVYTGSGATATRVARMRPEVPIIVVSPDERIARRIALLWGCHTLRSKEISTFQEMVDDAREIVQKEEIAKRHEHMVIVAGFPFGIVGSTNNLRVIEV